MSDEEFIVIVTTRDPEDEESEQTFGYGPFDYEHAEGFVDVACEHDFVQSDADVRMIQMNDVQSFMMAHSALTEKRTDGRS